MFLLFSFFFSNSVFATTGVPTLLHHQGRLLNSSGSLLGGSSGTNYCFKFSLYDNATVGSGAKLWPSSAPTKMTVNVKNGILNVDIGNTSVGGEGDALNFDFNSTDEVYLNIQVADSSGGSCASVADGSYETLSPRQRIVSAGYAINSKTATNLNGGLGGQIPYQSATGITAMLANGSAGQVLQSNGTTLAPSWVSASAGDMVLASIQTITGAKTFNDTKLLLRNVANTFNGSFTNTNTADRVYTLKDASGTLAFTSDITGINSGTNTGDNATNTQYSGLAASKADVGQTMYIGTTQVAINRASSALVLTGITSLTPGADFTLSQNSVNVLTSENTGAIANTFYLKQGNVGIGTTAPLELLSLGLAGTTAGKLSLAGLTSGKAIINVNAIAGTPTLTLPTITGTLALLTDVINQPITGFISGSGAVVATDTILQTFQKVDGNIALKAPIASPTFTGILTTPAITLEATALTATGIELNYVAGVTSAIQTQLNGKQATGSYALTTGTLAQFAATTSAQLAGVISDETGTGALTFGTAPTFTTNITTPLIIGGTAIGSNIIYKSTTGIGTVGGIAHQFVGGTDGATVAATILNNGNVGIGTVSPGAKLEISRASGGNLRLSDPNLAHGMTTIIPTNVHATWASGGSKGGAMFAGYTIDAITALDFWGYMGTGSPTWPAVSFVAMKKDGTTVQAMAATDMAFQFKNGDYPLTPVPLVSILGNGNVGIRTTSPT